MPNLDESQISMQDSLRDLGANSVDRADLLMQTMESLEVMLPMIEFASAQNIGDIISLFEQACSEK